MKGLADAGLVDADTNVGERGYHAQRLCSVQFFKPTLVTNYLCGGGFETFKYCCPGFFMMRNETMDAIYPLLEKYYRMNFITTFKSTIPFEKQMQWQEGGQMDLKLWDEWSNELKKLEDEIKTLLFEAKAK
jgi:hypothetical protein